MRRIIFTSIAFLLIVNKASSQKYQLNKVTVAELAEKVHPTDSSAAAAYLFKSGSVYFELADDGLFSLVQEVKCKIKIYKKEGYSYANFEVPVYTGGRTVRLYFDDAAAFNLVGNKVERTKLKSDGEFEEKVNENYTLRKIALPNVKEGSIVEYRYTLKTPYYNYFPDWYFQHTIPVNKVQYQVSIPAYFTYQRFLKGFEKVEASADVLVKAYNGRYNETKVVYNASDLKAIKEEPYVNNMDNYTTMIQYELASVAFPNQAVETYSTDWESVVKTIYDSDLFGKELDKRDYFEADLETLLAGVTGRDNRIMAVFNYVKSKMNWNDKYGYYTDLGVKKAYAEKIGNVADINLMLVAMLRRAQIKCNPILISTRSNGISLFPNRGAFNYVIAGVELESEIMLLDATTKNALPNIVPIRVLNWTGRLIREDKTSKEINVMPVFNSKENVVVMAAIDADGKVKGQIRNTYFDYNSYLFREKYASMSKDSYLENFEKRNPGVYVGEYTLLNDTDLLKPVVETYGFTTENIIERIGDKIYFSPMLFFATTTNPFKQETRAYPLDFSFPYQDKHILTLTIPEGYEVEYLPKPIAIGIEQNIANFKFTIVQSGSQIQVSVSSEINYSKVSADFYPGLKTYFKEMIEKQGEKIVLKKI
jgi:transglutaminase-like putative cysteine protease